MWLSFAAARGDAEARAGLRDVSQTMTPREISRANELAKSCEAQNYQACEN
jgi:hypothetical protein